MRVSAAATAVDGRRGVLLCTRSVAGAAQQASTGGTLAELPPPQRRPRHWQRVTTAALQHPLRRVRRRRVGGPAADAPRL